MLLPVLLIYVFRGWMQKRSNVYFCAENLYSYIKFKKVRVPCWMVSKKTRQNECITYVVTSLHEIDMLIGS